MKKVYLSMNDCREAAKATVMSLVDEKALNLTDKIRIYGIPRGGAVPAQLVNFYFAQFGFKDCWVVDKPEEANLFIDDLVDSGVTKLRYKAEYPSPAFEPLFYKNNSNEWYIFPWDNDGDEEESAEDIPIRLLQYIGEDPKRGGLQETPKRFLKAWGEWTSGYDQDPKEILKTFEDGAEGCDEMVLVKDIPVYSHCEHHLAPFFGVAHIGYIPNQKIVGLSKLPRLVDIYSRRLQVQERLTNQIANAIEKYLAPVGVAVVLECRHMCMESRGIQRQGCTTTTSAVRGGLKDDPSARAEFMGLIK